MWLIYKCLSTAAVVYSGAYKLWLASGLKERSPQDLLRREFGALEIKIDDIKRGMARKERREERWKEFEKRTGQRFEDPEMDDERPSALVDFILRRHPSLEKEGFYLTPLGHARRQPMAAKSPHLGSEKHRRALVVAASVGALSEQEKSLLPLAGTQKMVAQRGLLIWKWARSNRKQNHGQATSRRKSASTRRGKPKDLILLGELSGEIANWWTLPFCIFVFLSMFLFFMLMFLFSCQYYDYMVFLVRL